MTTRRDVLKGAGLAAGSGLLAASIPAGLRTAMAASNEPVRVAIVVDTSKVYGFVGNLYIKGLEMAFAEVGNEILGRKVEVVIEDTEANPAVGFAKAKKVLATFKPHFFLGPIASSTYAAMKDLVTRSNTIWLTLTQGAGAEDTVLPICSRNTFSVTWNNWQLSNPFGQWAYKNIAKEFWLGFANYNWGQGAGAVFKEAFEKAGGKITGTIAPPLGTADYAPFLSRVVAEKPPAIFCFFAGGDAVNFVKQWHQFGLHKTTKLTGQGFLVDEAVLPAQGKAALGATTVLNWARTLDVPENKKFQDAFTARYEGKLPIAIYPITGYDAGRLIIESVTNAKTTETDKLIPVIEQTALKSPRGTIRFDPKTHEAIQPYYIRETRLVGGKVTNVVIDTLAATKTPAKACSL